MSGTPDAHDLSPALAGTVLGFDFGTRKLGVALGNTVTGSARPLVTVREEAKAARFAAIERLIAEWGPVALVVGRPVHADGTAHETTRLAERFARALRTRFALPVAEVDERYTTQIADTMQRDHAARGASAPDRDALAAQIILQAWLDARSRP
jgi:putative Holliday junction resolvase